MDPEQGAGAVRLGSLLYQAHVVARRAVNGALRDLGLELRDVGVLELLGGGDSWSQQQLGERLGIDKSAMVRLVDTFERTGLVARRRRGDDRRAYAITITDAGRASLAEAYVRAAGAMDRLLVGFSETERDVLGGLLERLVRRAD